MFGLSDDKPVDRPWPPSSVLLFSSPITHGNRSEESIVVCTIIEGPPPHRQERRVNDWQSIVLFLLVQVDRVMKVLVEVLGSHKWRCIYRMIS